MNFGLQRMETIDCMRPVFIGEPNSDVLRILDITEEMLYITYPKMVTTVVAA